MRPKGVVGQGDASGPYRLAFPLSFSATAGGTTAYDATDAALCQIMAEWTSNDSYTLRVEKLLNGSGGLPKLDGTTVSDDGDMDTLAGGPAFDLFYIRGLDQWIGLQAGEHVY